MLLHIIANPRPATQSRSRSIAEALMQVLGGSFAISVKDAKASKGFFPK